MKLSSQPMLGSSQVTHNMHMSESLVYLCTQTSKLSTLVPGTRMIWLREHYGGFGRSMEESLTQLKVVISPEEAL